MLFWIYMFLVTLIIPCAMYFVGKKYLTSPPEYINNTKGFRTKRSMKNPLTWEFAQKHFGRLWYKGAPWTAIFSSLAMLYSIGKTIAFIGFCGGCVIVIQLAVIIILGIITNSALKRNFTDEGNGVVHCKCSRKSPKNLLN